MGFKLNPFTGRLDAVDSPNGVFEDIEVNGDITLDGRFISSLNGAASAPPGTFTGTWFTGGTATTTKPQVLVEPTGATSTAWSTSSTGLGVNAASGFAGNLLDLAGEWHKKAAITSGALNLACVTIFPNGPAIFLNGGGVNYFAASASAGLTIRGDISAYSFTSSNTALGTIDLSLFRDAADTLAQRNGTNAQTSRVYGTYTDASNYVRAALNSTSTAVTLAAETAGTGADDIPLNLTAAGTGTVKVNSVAEVVVSSTVAGLPAAPVVGMLTRVTDATAPAVSSTDRRWWRCRCLCRYHGANSPLSRLILMANSHHNRRLPSPRHHRHCIPGGQDPRGRSERSCCGCCH
jgi:hypothetical protein